MPNRRFKRQRQLRITEAELLKRRLNEWVDKFKASSVATDQLQFEALGISVDLAALLTSWQTSYFGILRILSKAAYEGGRQRDDGERHYSNNRHHRRSKKNRPAH